jgi:tetratricopeptide (TPR) repeat protein
MATLETGRLLAHRYLLQDRLGDGGHAEVWKARDTLEGRAVALKFLHLRGGGANDALPVLKHEAQMAQHLDHPGVLKVQDPEQDESFAFLPMEFAAGGDASRLRGAPWQRVLPVLLQTARVLEHAHARGVVHRDLKPRNVLFDTLGNVRVSDFGAAARTGSSDAPATGSPFSASPQQLRDEPATPADDVYGLGALAYELLTRYPPFYPNFDARRVQDEEPAEPVPVHPAPPELLDLIRSMLARDAGMRPALGTVMAAFEALLAAAVPASTGDVTLVDEPAVQARTALPASMGARRRSGMFWSLGIAAVAAAGIAVLVSLPDPAPVAPEAVAEVEALPVRVADAVLPESLPGPLPESTASAPAPAPPAAEDLLQDALRAGQAALAAMQSEQARAAFRHALALQPDDMSGRQGLEAADRLQAQLAGLADGARLEARGELSRAADQYRLLLANDAGFAPARTALGRVEQGMRERALESLLTSGAESLRSGRIADAGSAYQQAAEIDPDNARVQEGLQRVAQVLANERNTRDMAAGARLEESEQWDEAVTHYRAVLDRDADLGFAQDGLARSESRAALDHELRDYLARPERLTAPAVQQAAERALARGQASAGNAPHLQQQLQQLRSRLEQLTVEVRVAITSDNSTHVSLAPVGDLGRFNSRTLELPPGHYTLTGRRDGFRDVRYEFEIAPGQVAKALSVQCTERI